MGSPWTCVNPRCSVNTLGTDKEPVKTAGGHFLCPECSQYLSYRCGGLFLPVGEVVPPDVCQTHCKHFSCCIRYRLHDVCQREVATWASWPHLDLQYDALGYFLDEEVLEAAEDVSLPGARPLSDA